MQSPRHGHREFAFVAHVVRGAEKPERAVVASKSRKKLNRGVPLSMVLVAQAGFAVGSCYGLAFPVDQVAANGVVAVARGR